TCSTNCKHHHNLDIRCVAAPIKDAANKIIAAISVAGISSFMTEERIKDLIPVVIATAKNISLELGWYELSSLAAANRSVAEYDIPKTNCSRALPCRIHLSIRLLTPKWLSRL
ncbi:TPA: hypothetical protein L9085_005283, partial [Klebsiella pneumoniae]|uniref:IclR family transcriptional regulator domain-containing protein n=1 Tax=Klebsiella variicola TaxID=244366 RepID=UPI0023725543|nr:hypothetical protein [Klebsiella pneumoniae]HDK6616732.1 hypothetical protein [Klebsiella variicola]